MKPKQASSPPQNYLQSNHSTQLNKLEGILKLENPKLGENPGLLRSNIEKMVGAIAWQHTYWKSDDRFEELMLDTLTALAKYTEKVRGEALASLALINSNIAQDVVAARALLLSQDDGIRTLDDLQTHVSRIYDQLLVFRLGMELGTDITITKKPGRKKVRATKATKDFADAWEAITGRKIVTPDTKPTSRGSADDGAREPSTQFVHICLSLVFGKGHKIQNTRTAVRTLLKSRKAREEFLNQLKTLPGETWRDKLTAHGSVKLKSKLLAYAKMQPKKRPNLRG